MRSELRSDGKLKRAPPEHRPHKTMARATEFRVMAEHLQICKPEFRTLI